MARGEQGNQRHRSAVLRARIVELRDEGLTFQAIAAEVGISAQTTWQHYQNAMREIPAAAVKVHQETIEKRRDEQLRRIDMEREAVMAVLTARHLTISNGHIIAEIVGRDEAGKPIYGEPILDDGPVLTAVDRLHKLDDQEAKLLGLYPKTQISVQHEPSDVDQALADLVRDANAHMAAAEAKARADVDG